MNYLLVLPSYKAIGFYEVEDARGALNYYHENRIESKNEENTYSQYDMFEEKSREDISYVIGAEEGEGRIYDIENLIENIRASGLFQDEKEEIINQLIKSQVNFDMSKYDLETILADTNVY